MTVATLQGLTSDDPAAVWRAIADLVSPDEFAVALDYALEHGLLASDFAAQLRGEPSPSPPGYWVNPIDGSEMVWIQAGAFLAGDRVRKLHCHGFFLARHPVTNEKFARFLNESGYEPPADDPLRNHFLQHWSGGRPTEKQLQLPVVWVSFVDAWHYCQWAQLAVPNEWHWEKAARGIDGRTFPWGEASPQGVSYFKIDPLAQVRSKEPRPVGSFSHARSPFGCENLVGNVSEWCQYSEPDPSGFVRQFCPALGMSTLDYLGSREAVRGSAFLRRQWSRMGAAHRRRLAVGRRNRWVGFRPAFYPPATRVR